MKLTFAHTLTSFTFTLMCDGSSDSCGLRVAGCEFSVYVQLAHSAELSTRNFLCAAKS